MSDDHVVMVLTEPEKVRRFSLPEGMSFRRYNDVSDGEVWKDIHMAVGEFETREAAEAKYDSFVHEQPRSLDKMFFVVDDETGEPIATATAWQREFRGSLWGLVHWVAVDPRYTGRGIARALVREVVEELDTEFGHVWLKTKKDNSRAIHVYEQCGFVIHEE